MTSLAAKPSNEPNRKQPSVKSKTPRSTPSGPGAPTVWTLLFLYAALALWLGSRRDFWGVEPEMALVAKEMESALLDAFYQNHLEVPPFNRKA